MRVSRLSRHVRAYFTPGEYAALQVVLARGLVEPLTDAEWAALPAAVKRGMPRITAQRNWAIKEE